MKKLIIIVIIILLNSITLDAQNYNCLIGNKSYLLSPNNNKILIKLTKQYQETYLINYFKEVLTRLKLVNYSIRYIKSLSTIELETKETEQISNNFNLLKKEIINEEIIASIEPFYNFGNKIYGGITDEILIEIKDIKNKENIIKDLNGFDFTLGIKEDFIIPELLVLFVNKNYDKNLFEICNQLKENNLLSSVEPNFYFNNIIDSDPLYTQQWNLKNNGQLSFNKRVTVGTFPNNTWTWVNTTISGNINNVDINVEPAWLISRGIPEIRVAVIDEFIDYEHPDLKANVLIDEVFDPFNVNIDYVSLNRNPIGSHGTCTSGIIAAIKNNEEGISGIAPNCKIIPVASFGQSGNLTTQSLADGIAWAILKNADIISNSWSLYPLPSAILTEINNATTNGRNGLGSLLFFTSGNFAYGGGNGFNENEVSGTGRPDNVICVGATTMCNERKSSTSCDGETYWGSHYGPELDVVAPSTFIVTTDNVDIPNFNNLNYGYTDLSYMFNFNGTSAACPQVSGIAALILSVNRCLTWQQVKYIIESTCDKVGNYCYTYSPDHPSGSWNNEMGYGRINAYQAVLKALTNPQLSSNFIDQPNNSPHNTIQSNIPIQINYRDNCSNFNNNYSNVDKIEVTRDISFSSINNPIINGSSNGYSSSNIITTNEINWCGVRNITNNSAQVFTYVYFDGANYYPCNPNDIRFNIYLFDNESGSAPNNIDLSNQNISTNQNLVALNSIEAGNLSNLGNYLISSGNTTFRAGQFIKLSPGFKAQAQTGSHILGEINKFNSCSNFALGKIAVKGKPKLEGVTKDIYAKYTTGNNSLPINEVSFNVFPNPVVNDLNIIFSEQKFNTKIIIYDLTGKQVYSSIENTGKNNIIKINLSNFISGLYLIQIHNGDKIVNQKFLKE